MNRADFQTYPAAPVESRRVLVVEDNRAVATLLALVLAKLGSQVQTAYDGEAGLEAAKSYQPDVIFLDIGLPGIDGFELARRLRQLAQFQKTLLVAVTGYGSEDDKRRSAEAGIDKHLVKPASLEDLRQVLSDPRLTSP